MPTAQHRDFSAGFIQDEASFLLPEGAVYSSKNMLFDKIGIARKRGGITGVGATATYEGAQLGTMVDDFGTRTVWAFQPQNGVSATFYLVNVATGAMTNVGGLFRTIPNLDGGRPFLHHGFLMFPNQQGGVHGCSAVSTGGPVATAPGGGSFTTPGGVTVTAGSRTITCAVADDPTTKLQVGLTVSIMGGATNNIQYIGRITALVSTTSFEVFPTPTVTLTPFPGAAPNTNLASSFFATGQINVGGPVSTIESTSSKVGMSFQGRVVLGNCGRCNAGVFATGTQSYPRRVWFSSTLLEGDATASGETVSGALWLTANGYPNLNYFDIPVQEAITCITPTGFGDALIFSAFRCFRLTGNLSTQYGTTPSVTWSVREVPNSVGCMSERSMRATPRGVVFAHDSGIYATDGTTMLPLMDKRVSSYWKALQGTNFKVYGSALIRGNHYYVCGLDSAGNPWGLLLNLDTLAWSAMGGKTSAPASWIINSGVQDPLNPQRIWGLKGYDLTITSGGVSMTGGQLVFLDQMFNPISTNKADSDTTTVNFELVTRSYAEDSPTQQKVWEKATIEYENIGGPAVAVTPAAILDSGEVPAGGTNYFLPRQDVYTITAATNATPIVVTCGSHDIKVDSWVHVQGVGGNTAANGPWRVQAVSATTVTLMASIGNGAYTSGGTIQNLDQRDIPLDAVSQGAQSNNSAMVYRINDTDSGGTQGAESFELYGITHSWSERDPHTE